MVSLWFITTCWMSALSCAESVTGTGEAIVVGAHFQSGSHCI